MKKNQSGRKGPKPKAKGGPRGKPRQRFTSRKLQAKQLKQVRGEEAAHAKGAAQMVPAGTQQMHMKRMFPSRSHYAATRTELPASSGSGMVLPMIGNTFETFVTDRESPFIQTFDDAFVYTVRQAYLSFVSDKISPSGVTDNTPWTNLVATMLNLIDLRGRVTSKKDWDSTQRTHLSEYMALQLYVEIELMWQMCMQSKAPLYIIASGADNTAYWTIQGCQTLMLYLKNIQLPGYQFIHRLARQITQLLPYSMPYEPLGLQLGILQIGRCATTLTGTTTAKNMYTCLSSMMARKDGFVHAAKIGLMPSMIIGDDIEPVIGSYMTNSWGMFLRTVLSLQYKNDSATEGQLSAEYLWSRSPGSLFYVSWDAKEFTAPPDFWSLAPYLDKFESTSSRNNYGWFSTVTPTSAAKTNLWTLNPLTGNSWAEVDTSDAVSIVCPFALVQWPSLASTAGGGIDNACILNAICPTAMRRAVDTSSTDYSASTWVARYAFAFLVKMSQSDTSVQSSEEDD